MRKRLMKKQIAVFVLAAALIMGLGACGDSSQNPESQEKASTEVQEDAAAVTTEALAQEAEASAEALDEAALADLAPAEAEEADNEALESVFTDASSSKDTEIKQSVLLSTENDQYAEYQVVYYGASDDVLKAVHVEDHFFKSAGYTEEVMEKIDINQLYPGISDLPFVKTTYSDEGDYYSFVIEYNELDNAEHLDQLYDCNCKLEATKGTGQLLSGESYITLLRSQGAKDDDDAVIHTTLE